MHIKQFLIAAVIVLVLLLISVCSFFAFNSYIYNEKQGVATTTPSYAPYTGTLTGVQTCLPHKDTSGPQTLECAIGMQTDVGEYYSLDLNQVPELMTQIQTGSKFTATGLITPIENLSSDHLRKYDIVGIFSVATVVSVEGKIEPKPVDSTPTLKPDPKPSTPKQSATGKCYIGGCSSQICSGEPDMASTCEYREQYACYQTATCERQTTGVCGWTETAELKACLAK